MADTDQILRDLIARVDALEVRNDRLEAENRALRGERGERGERSTEAMITAAGAAVDRTEPLSRRAMLQRGLQAAAATAAAGVLLQREAPAALAADGSFDTIYVQRVYASGNEYGAVDAQLTGDIPAVSGQNGGSGWGVRGTNNGAGPAVEGDSYAEGGIGVKGFGTTYGVVVESTQTGSYGILGANGFGVGVHGLGKTGMYAKSIAPHGYGAVIEGGKAQLRLVPKTTAGKPTSGAHAKGEMLLDKNATLWICTIAGTPGTWRKVSTTLA